MRERLRRYGFRALLAGLGAGAAYYLVFGGVYSVFDIAALERRQAEAVRRVDSLEFRADSLAREGDSLIDDPAAIERVAREEYGLIRDGEVLVRFHPVRDDADGEAELQAARELDE